MKKSIKTVTASRETRMDEWIMSPAFERLQKRLTGKTRKGRPVQKRTK